MVSKVGRAGDVNENLRYAKQEIDDLQSGIGIEFIQSGTGAVATDLQTRGRRIVYLTDYGGSGDAGVTDNGVALQAAHDALGADGGSIIIPPTATYYGFTTGAAFTKPIRIVGEDWYCSEFLTSTASLTMITTTKKLVVENINFTALSSAIASAIAIKTLAAAANHGGTHIRNCYFTGFIRCYWSERSNAFHIDGCKFAADGYCLYLENTTSSDEGDSFVSNSTFSGTAGDTCIHVASTSGINFNNNKFNTGVAVHVDIAPTSNAVGNFLFSNNSFEGHLTAGIRLIATTGSITKTVICGNQFSSDNMTHVIVGKFAKNTVITGNVFNDTNPANGIGVDIQASAQNTTIVGNEFHQILTAINTDATITGQTIHSNKFVVMSSGSVNVTNLYLGGENDNNLNGPGSEKSFELDRLISTTSNASYTNAIQLKGDCILEVFATGVVQGSGDTAKYRKVLITGDTTATDLIAEVTVGSAWDMQIASSGGYTVVGGKRNGATGTSLTVQMRIKVSGYVRDLSKV